MLRRWQICAHYTLTVILCFVVFQTFSTFSTVVKTNIECPVVIVPNEGNSMQDFNPDVDYLSRLRQDDPLLIQIIKNWFLEAPPDPKVPYNFEKPNPNLNGQVGQVPIIDAILGKKRDGFFIECGAYDGEAFSNSLLFELERNWTGILIEPNFKAFKDLKDKQRKAYLFNGCLSGSRHAERIDFLHAAMVGGLNHIEVPNNIQYMRTLNQVPSVSKATCLPLYSLLLAVGNPTVDFFSLDVEGAEWVIVQSIPWSAVDIRVVMIETVHLGPDNDKLEKFMVEQGYDISDQMRGQDTIFIKKNVT